MSHSVKVLGTDSILCRFLLSASILKTGNIYININLQLPDQTSTFMSFSSLKQDTVERHDTVLRSHSGMAR